MWRKKFFLWVLLLIVFAAIVNSKVFWRFFYPFPHKEIIIAESAGYNIDPYLVAAVIKTESNFSSEAESRMGARGIMQIMPETGAWAAEQMGLKGFDTDDLYQTETNIRIGCWYLNNLNKEFNGNKILVIAAYNGGRGNVREWLQKEQWTGEHANIDQIPFSETREYVRKVMKNYEWYRYLYGST